nr:unnamed protein product [Callosobruchus chinensis]
MKIMEMERLFPELRLTQVSEGKAQNRSFVRHFSRGT